MAAPKTEGFALSALPRAPAIPANAGVIDIKSVVDGVRQSLAAFENVRRAPASMLLADAEMEAKTAEAPLEARRALAQTQGIEDQTPFNTAILAEKANPERIALERAALTAKNTKQPSGDVQLANALAAAQQRVAEDGTDEYAKRLVAILSPMAVNKGADSLKNPQGAIEAGITKNDATNATRLQTTAMTTEAQRDIAALTDDRLRELAASSDETKRTLAANELATRERISRNTLESHERVNKSQQAHKALLANAKTAEQKAQVGAKARQALAIGENRNQLFNETVARTITNLTGSEGGVATDSAIPGGNIASAIFRVVSAFVPGSKSADLDRLVETLKSEAGFNELATMRAAAPGKTGASGLGQVTEKEMAYLQSRLANLKTSQSDKQLYENIIAFQQAVNDAWKNVRQAYEFDYGTPQATASAAAPGAGAMAAPAAVPDFATSEEADAAGAAGTIQPGQKITVGKRPATWVAP